jgi:hypothetical protein
MLFQFSFHQLHDALSHIPSLLVSGRAAIDTQFRGLTLGFTGEKD